MRKVDFRRFHEVSGRFNLGTERNTETDGSAGVQFGP